MLDQLAALMVPGMREPTRRLTQGPGPAPEGTPRMTPDQLPEPVAMPKMPERTFLERLELEVPEQRAKMHALAQLFGDRSVFGAAARYGDAKAQFSAERQAKERNRSFRDFLKERREQAREVGDTASEGRYTAALAGEPDPDRTFNEMVARHQKWLMEQQRRQDDRRALARYKERLRKERGATLLERLLLGQFGGGGLSWLLESQGGGGGRPRREPGSGDSGAGPGNSLLDDWLGR